MFINRMAYGTLAGAIGASSFYWIGLLLLMYAYFTCILTNFQHLYRLNNNNKYLSYQVLDLHVRCTLIALRQRQWHSYSMYCIVNLYIAANEMKWKRRLVHVFTSVMFERPDNNDRKKAHRKWIGWLVRVWIKYWHWFVTLTKIGAHFTHFINNIKNHFVCNVYRALYQ